MHLGRSFPARTFRDQLRHPHPKWRFLVVFGVCLFAAPAALAVDAIVPQEFKATGFVENYCLECHRSGAAEAEREFDSFSLPLKTEQQLITVNEMIDQVTLHLMPPEEADQPTDDERVAFVTELRSHLEQARDQIKSSGGRTVMRRLSNREYENSTLR